MGEVIEAFISGFCRTSNETRTVACEYERQQTGDFRMTYFECNHEKCPNSSACLIYKEALEKEKRADLS